MQWYSINSYIRSKELFLEFSFVTFMPFRLRDGRRSSTCHNHAVAGQRAKGRQEVLLSVVDHTWNPLYPIWRHIYIYIYSIANKKFAVLRRNRSDPLSRAMGCIGELRAGSRSAGYQRFGTGNLAPLAALVPIPKSATHSKGASNQYPHCTVYICIYIYIYIYIYILKITHLYGLLDKTRV